METLVFGHFVNTSPWPFWSADHSQATAAGENAQPQPTQSPKARKSVPAPATVSAFQPTDAPLLLVLPLF